jgi:type II secretory pathway pseudopilin PulG
MVSTVLVVGRAAHGRLPRRPPAGGAPPRVATTNADFELEEMAVSAAAAALTRSRERWSPLRARPAGEGGFALIELLVAMSLALILLTATLAIFTTSQKDEQGLFSRADAVQLANAGLREMDQDLRQAYEINFPLAATTSNGCTASSGKQPCNIIDVLARLTSTGYSYTDYEVRYDCTVASTTITSDTSCWRYLCSASATTSTSSSCLASSSNLLSSREVIDDVSNGATPVFSLCYTATSTSGAACAAGGTATSATVTINTPAAGTLSTSAGGDRSTIVLSDGIFMPDLSYGQ